MTHFSRISRLWKSQPSTVDKDMMPSSLPISLRPRLAQFHDIGHGTNGGPPHGDGKPTLATSLIFALHDNVSMRQLIGLVQGPDLRRSWRRWHSTMDCQRSSRVALHKNSSAALTFLSALYCHATSVLDLMTKWVLR